MKEFKWLVRVYYEDTDAGGIVYHTSYLKYMERARTEYLRALGYNQTRLRAEQGILFVVNRIDINFSNGSTRQNLPRQPGVSPDYLPGRGTTVCGRYRYRLPQRRPLQTETYANITTCGFCP